MASSKKYLRSKDLKIIRYWIGRVERKKYKPKKSSHKKAWKRLKKMNYKKIGKGKKRIVLSIRKKNVLKVATSVNGIRDIKREVEVYRKASKRLRRHLAKVKGHGHGWLVMRKMTRKVRKRKGIKRRVRRLEKRFLRGGIRPRDLFSTKKRRVRWENLRLGPKKRLVVIDYGNFKVK